MTMRVVDRTSESSAYSGYVPIGAFAICKQLSKRCASNKLGNDVSVCRVGRSLMQRHDSGVRESSRCLDLSLSALTSQLRWNRFDRNLPIKSLIYGAPDRAESSRANCFLEPVATHNDRSRGWRRFPCSGHSAYLRQQLARTCPLAMVNCAKFVMRSLQSPLEWAYLQSASPINTRIRLCRSSTTNQQTPASPKEIGI